MGEKQLEVNEPEPRPTKSLLHLTIEPGAIPTDKLDDILLFFGLGGLALAFLLSGQVDIASTIAKGLSGAIFMYVKGK